MKILIAEDDPVSRTVVKRTVEKMGHECLTAKDGLEAWRIYQDTPDVEVVISDWMMPGMDGLEFCRRVRGLDREGYTFFIFLTALGGKEHLLEGMQAGADEYLTKPLDGEQLRVKLIAASRVASLHRHMSSEDDGTTEDGKASVPAIRSSRTVSPGVRGGKAWDVLVSQGKITEEQLQQALVAQKSNPAELGKVLVSLGIISHEELAQAEAQRLNLEYTKLSEADVDREAARLIPEKMLRRHGALPLYKEDGQLYVAMSDPTNIYALDDLRMISGLSIVPVVTTEESLERTRTSLFSAGEQVADILQEANEAAVVEEGDLQLEVGTDVNEAPVVRVVNSILQQAIGDEASDIHVEPHPRELAVRFRVDGVLREVMSVPSNLQSGVAARLKLLANLDIAERRVPQDGRFSATLGGRKIDFRATSLPTAHGEAVVLRLLDTSNLQAHLTELGFAPEILERYEEIFRRPYGTILVTGPTGSGKSTTLYATLGELNSPERKIITIEDPIEYRVPGLNQVQVNPKAGLTFASGLRSFLRADPDVLMIGEIRDRETAKISVEAALTGHLVLSTLHTKDAPGALTRLTDMGVEPFLTSSAVDCVIAQRLARRLCQSCKQPVEIERGVLEQMDFPFGLIPEGGLAFNKAVGCDECGETGYRGRIALYEMMVVSEGIKDLILRRASAAEIGQAAKNEGMVRLREDGLVKAARGLTTVEEVLRTVL